MVRGRLLIQDGLGQRVVPLDRPLIDIGRRAQSDVRVTGSDVSRDHAEIESDGEAFILRDKGSRYGTFVNGEQITEHRLSSRDRIQFGRASGTEVVFLAGDDDDAAAAHVGDASPHGLRELSALLEGLRALGTGRVLDEVLILVLDAAIEVTGAERGFVMLAGADGLLEFKLARVRGHVTLPGNAFQTSRKIPEEVFRSGEMRIIADLLEGDLSVSHEGTVSLGIRNVICAPLTVVRYLDRAEDAADNTRLGVLYLDSRERGTLLSAATRVALDTLASEASVAIENARLYREQTERDRLEQEIRIAAEIQQALQPRPHTRWDFVEAAGVSIPCRTIGGDYFDYSKEPGDVFSFVVGDVAGKGAPAAFMSALMQGMCGLFVQDGEEPASAVTSMNRALFWRGLGARYVSLVFGALSADGQLTFCNAGYNSPLVIGPAGARRLETGGSIVGLFESAMYEQETVQLEPGDAVVIWSDGVAEALNVEGEEFGDARVQAAMEQQGAAGADQLVERITASVKTFAQGNPQTDDITVMVIRYLGAGSEARH